MQCAPRAQVHHALLAGALALQFHQTPHHLLTGKQMHKALARNLRGFHLLLAVQPTVQLFTDKQCADTPALIP